MEGDGIDAAAAATDPIRPALVEIIDAVLAGLVAFNAPFVRQHFDALTLSVP